jgi:four helix bundle protein
MLRVVRFCRTLPATAEGQEIGRQLIRAAMGTADNYRSAQRARSLREFASRLAVALDEADEAHSWLSAACELGIGGQPEAEALKKEAGELCAIFGRSNQTARRPRRPMTR